MKKKYFAAWTALVLALTAPAALADGSWSQINQALAPNAGWQRFVTAEDFHLGDELESPYPGVKLYSWGTYPSMDGSTVCVPLAMELARQWLHLEEADLSGFVNFSTTPNAYERLAKGEANPTVTLLSRNAAMDDTHPIDLVLATYPNADEVALAAAEGADLVYVPFCYDAFVFLVNAQQPVEGLTHQQIRSIYTGQLISWDEVGGEPEPIIAYQRPHGSGSQTAMEEMVMDGAQLTAAEPMYVTDGMGDLVEQVGSFTGGRNALGYSYLYYVEGLYKSGDIKVLAVDGAAPTAENIRSGAYPYGVNYWAVYRREDANTAAFVDWLISAEGQKCVAQAGYIPVDAAADNVPVGIGGDTAAVAAEPLLQLKGQPLSLPRASLPVYRGPGTRYGQSADGKAKVATGGGVTGYAQCWVQEETPWLLISYEVSDTVTRFGWVNVGEMYYQDEAAWDALLRYLPRLQLDEKQPRTGTLTTTASLSDQPDGKAGGFYALPRSETVEIIAAYADQLLVRVGLYGGAPQMGFVPASAVEVE